MDQYRQLDKEWNDVYATMSKWLTYFALIIGGLGVAYYSIMGIEGIGPYRRELLLFAVSGLGYLASLSTLWAIRGFHRTLTKYASITSEYRHVIFEGGSVYSRGDCQASKMMDEKSWWYENANLSTAKVGILFLYCLTIFWGTLALVHPFFVFREFFVCSESQSNLGQCVWYALACVTVLIVIILLFRLLSCSVRYVLKHQLIYTSLLLLFLLIPLGLLLEVCTFDSEQLKIVDWWKLLYVFFALFLSSLFTLYLGQSAIPWIMNDKPDENKGSRRHCDWYYSYSGCGAGSKESCGGEGKK